MQSEITEKGRADRWERIAMPASQEELDPETIAKLMERLGPAYLDAEREINYLN